MAYKNIEEALELLKELSNDPEVMEAARQREMSGVLLATSLAEAERRGEARGREKVRKEEEKAAQRQILQGCNRYGIFSGKSLAEIAEMAGLPESLVKELLEDKESL